MQKPFNLGTTQFQKANGEVVSVETSFQFAPKLSKYWTRGLLSNHDRAALASSELKVNFAHLINITTGERTYRKGISIVVADFDKLPVTEGYTSFADLLADLKRWFGQAIVMHSKSGRAKVFFLVDFSGVRVDSEARTKALLAILPEHLHKWLDLAAINESFFNERMLSDWTSQVGDLKAYSAKELFERCAEGEATVEKLANAAKPSRGSLSLSESQLKRLIEAHPSLKLSPAEQRVAANVLATPGLLNEKGAEFPQRIIAEAVNCSQTLVNFAIKKLIEAGIIEMANAKYFPGKRSKAYRIVDEAAKSLYKEFLTSINYQSRAERECLPELTEGNTFVSMPAYVRQAVRLGMDEDEAASWIHASSYGKMTLDECAARVKSLYQRAR